MLSPVEATKLSVERIRRGEDTISVTGNVLRDYLTDLFPILELGTSAKMLSVVPLMNGGGLFETGAGGSAPKHVQQLVKENYLRWDSLGEFLALAVSFEQFADHHRQRARAGPRGHPGPGHRDLPERGQVPQPQARRDRQPRLALLPGAVLGQELAAQTEDAQLAAAFAALAATLAEQEKTIVDELIAVQGSPVDLGGYYQPDPAKASKAMRPSATFNQALELLNEVAPRRFRGAASARMCGSGPRAVRSRIELVSWSAGRPRGSASPGRAGPW